MLEDRGHHFWFFQDGEEPREILCKRVDGFAINAEEIPGQVDRVAEIRVRVAPAWNEEKPIRFFWRADAGPWQGGDTDPRLAVVLPGSGKHRVEILGMGPQGETTPRTIEATIEARGTGGAGRPAVTERISL